MKALRVIIAIVAVGAAAYVVYHFHERRQIAAMNNRAAGLLGQENYAEARDLLEKAIQKDSRNHSMWKNLGIAYEGLGDDAKALEAFDRSLAIQPSQPDVKQQADGLRALIEARKKATGGAANP